MKELLLVIDYQNDFVDGALGFEEAKTLEDGIVEKIKDYKSRSQSVIFTLDTHGDDYLETKEGIALPVKHCIKGTDGIKLYGKVAEYESIADKVFEKDTFGSRELLIYLMDNPYDKIELVGLVSNICVLSNAIVAKTALPNAEIIVNSALTKSFDEKLNQETLDILKGLYITII